VKRDTEPPGLVNLYQYIFISHRQENRGTVNKHHPSLDLKDLRANLKAEKTR